MSKNIINILYFVFLYLILILKFCFFSSDVNQNVIVFSIIFMLTSLYVVFTMFSKKSNLKISNLKVVSIEWSISVITGQICLLIADNLYPNYAKGFYSIAKMLSAVLFFSSCMYISELCKLSKKTFSKIIYYLGFVIIVFFFIDLVLNLFFPNLINFNSIFKFMMT